MFLAVIFVNSHDEDMAILSVFYIIDLSFQSVLKFDFVSSQTNLIKILCSIF
jgi:hypothetical protein